MRVFVSEFLVGGASSALPVAASMRREGLSMLQAVTEDIARLPGYSVVTTLETGTPFSSGIDVVFVDDETQEAVEFQKMLGNVDAVLVIAPETNHILLGRCRRVRAAGVAAWNGSDGAIELCGDKLQLAKHLQVSSLPTIPTKIADLLNPPLDFGWPLVLKPRDGAGSQLTFRVDSQNDWERAAQSFRDAGAAENCLVQPFIEGKNLSVGVNIRFDGSGMECLPVAEQILSDDRQFRYLGGRIPAELPENVCDSIENLVNSTCRTIDGLAGYIGIDLLLTTGDELIIVEINPRLTTSYVGYRQLFSGALPERWIAGSSAGASANWKGESLEFRVDDTGVSPYCRKQDY